MRWLLGIVLALASATTVIAEPVVQPILPPPEVTRLMMLAELDDPEFSGFWDAAVEGGLSESQTVELLRTLVGDEMEFKQLWRQAKAEGVSPASLMMNLYQALTADAVEPAVGGGFAVPRGWAPYQAEMFQPWPRSSFTRDHLPDSGPLWVLQHMCGGSLLAPGWTGRSGWVLTAAHCIDPGDATVGYRIRLGTNVASTAGGYSYRIDEVIWHPGCVKAARDAPPTRYHDIALVHFSDDADTPPGRPAPLDAAPIALDRGAPPQQAARLAVSGWGLIGMEAQSQKLMEADLRSVSASDCNRMWRIGDAAHHGTLCAMGHIGVGPQFDELPRSCKGDSGGPLVSRNRPRRLIGIVSWNITGCRGTPDKPGVYTRVAAYAGWVDTTIARREAARRGTVRPQPPRGRPVSPRNGRRSN